MWCLLLPLLLLDAPVTSAAALDQLPHVSECNYCQECWYDQARSPTPSTPASLQQATAAAAQMVPQHAEWLAKQHKPNCTECWGCTTQLTSLTAIQAFGHNFSVEAGASSEWLFMADLPDSHLTGKKAVVKVWCVPISKVTGEVSAQHVACVGSELAVRGAKHLVALDTVTHECGLNDITIKTWVAPVNAVVPGLGLHIFWAGLWMERAPGLSLNQLAYIGRRDLVHTVILGLMQEKMNKTQVVRAAIYDLLTSQCDRHAQNVFIDEQGGLKLIDNLNSLQFSWTWCAQDSILVPGTQKFTIVRLGGNMVGKRPGARVRRSINPMVLLDYRCYVPGGELGTQHLPADVKQCLNSLSAMTADQVASRYGFGISAAAILVTRAQDILTKGFEWTLRRGPPLNKGPLRYKWHEPCCKVHLDKRLGLQCAHSWDSSLELPLGDASKGGPWTWPYADPGIYNGSTLWMDV